MSRTRYWVPDSTSLRLSHKKGKVMTPLFTHTDVTPWGRDGRTRRTVDKREERVEGSVRVRSVFSMFYPFETLKTNERRLRTCCLVFLLRGNTTITFEPGRVVWNTNTRFLLETRVKGKERKSGIRIHHTKSLGRQRITRENNGTETWVLSMVINDEIHLCNRGLWGQFSGHLMGLTIPSFFAHIDLN